MQGNPSPDPLYICTIGCRHERVEIFAQLYVAKGGNAIVSHQLEAFRCPATT